MTHTLLLYGLVCLGPAAAPADDIAASAQAQLAVAQSALCRATSAPVDDGAAAARLQHTAQVWVEAWDVAGRPHAARVEVRRCNPDPITQLYLEAVSQMAQAHFESAETALQQAVDRAPRAWCAGLRLRQGLCRLHRDAPEAALGFLQMAQHDAPTRVAIRLATAQAYLALRRPADTIASLRPILSEATQTPERREIEQARALTGMAIEQDAGHISPLERTAMRNLLAMAQSVETEAEAVEMALSLADAVPRPRVQTAAALVALKAQRVDVGRRLLKEAFTHASLDPDPARLLALYNVEHGGPTAALPCLALAAARDPFNSETQTLIADLEERTGDVDAAKQTLVALMRLEPDQARHKAAWSRLAALGRKPAADRPDVAPGAEGR